jgi:hypothetical protein
MLEIVLVQNRVVHHSPWDGRTRLFGVGKDDGENREDGR